MVGKARRVNVPRPDRRNPAEFMRRQARAQERDLQAIAHVLEHLQQLEGAQSFDELREGLSARGRRFSPWRLRELLRYLVLSQRVDELREDGRRAALFQAKRP